MFLSSVILQASDITLYVEIFFIIILLIIFLALFAASIKIVREYERVVQFRLGRLTGSKGPGIVLILPVINRLVKVDLRERYLEVPPDCNYQRQRTRRHRLPHLLQSRRRFGKPWLSTAHYR